MDDTPALDALVNDLYWQVDQMRSRGIKNNSGGVYVPAYYKRALNKAADEGPEAIVAFVQRFVHKAPSDGYKKLEVANALDLACEALVADETKPYAGLFSDEDREAARARLAPHLAAIESRNAKRRERIDASRARLREEGMPSRPDLDHAIRSRRKGVGPSR